MVHPEEEELDDELEDPEPYLLDDLSFLFRYNSYSREVKKLPLTSKESSTVFPL
jgi:hypothetical protein